MSLGCARCGLELPGVEDKDGFWLYEDGMEIVCEDCGSTNFISIDDHDCYEDYDIGTAWVRAYICKHETEEDQPCAECDEEDEKAYREMLERDNDNK